MDTLTTAAGELYTLYHKDIVRFFAEHLADPGSSAMKCLCVSCLRSYQARNWPTHSGGYCALPGTC